MGKAKRCNEGIGQKTAQRTEKDKTRQLKPNELEDLESNTRPRRERDGDETKLRRKKIGMADTRKEIGGRRRKHLSSLRAEHFLSAFHRHEMADHLL